MPKRRGKQPQQTITPAYLQSPPRIAVILGSFAVLAVPLVVLQLADVPASTRFALYLIYGLLLGSTHFVITLAIYLHGENLRYFASSASNIVIYFVVPASILVLFFVIGFFGLNILDRNASAGFALYVFCFNVGVRALDALHVVRQSFGVLQLFKAQTPAAFPRWMRTADNSFFLSMAGLQQLTFLNGVLKGNFVFTLGPSSAILLGCAALSFCGVIAGFVAAVRRTEKPGALWVPFVYFLFQGASASLPAMRSELYLASLAMHYVEYHVIIFPRLFTFDLNPASRADRAAAWARRHKLIFYIALAVLACFVSRELLPVVSTRVGSTRALWLMFNLLSGIFVTHYFIEAFIWRFRNPYYRKSLAPLYFLPPARPAAIST